MGDIRCCKTPILDLLRSVPPDGRATLEDGEGVSLTYHMIPYGHHCHEAADEIERLRKADSAKSKYIRELREAVQHKEDAIVRGLEIENGLRSRIEELEKPITISRHELLGKEIIQLETGAMATPWVSDNAEIKRLLELREIANEMIFTERHSDTVGMRKLCAWVYKNAAIGGE